MWMQICLGLHSLVGLALVPVTIPVLHGGHDLLAPKAPGLGVLLAGLGWLFVGWMLIRVRPMPEMRLQPESRFTYLPAVLVAVLNAIGWVAFSFLDHPTRNYVGFVLLADLIFMFWGPVSTVLWAIARIRYHVGTWVLAWGVCVAGLFLSFLLFVPMLMAD